jgi:hypothetical protein
MPPISTIAHDPANEVGAYASIAIGADGLPVISHQDNTASVLLVTRCGNAACSAGNETVTADDGNQLNLVGLETSIAIGADGLPVISHRDITASALRVTKCGNAGCTAGNVSTTVDGGAGSAGLYSSIAVDADGLPVISHQDVTSAALRVTRCGNPACTSGNVSTTVDNVSNAVGFHTSITVDVDGRPVIAHFDATASALRVTKCGNPACTTGNVSTTVDGPPHAVGEFPSIALGADGLPVISHRDISADGLRVTRCGNPACTAGNISTTVDDPGNQVGLHTSIVMGADGLPLIAHQDGTARALRVTRCGNAACTAGNISTTVDDPVNQVGLYASIAIGADGLPVIAYRDSTARALRVTKCGTPSCR